MVVARLMFPIGPVPKKLPWMCMAPLLAATMALESAQPAELPQAMPMQLGVLDMHHINAGGDVVEHGVAVDVAQDDAVHARGLDRLDDLPGVGGRGGDGIEVVVGVENDDLPPGAEPGDEAVIRHRFSSRRTRPSSRMTYSEHSPSMQTARVSSATMRSTTGSNPTWCPQSSARR